MKNKKNQKNEVYSQQEYKNLLESASKKSESNYEEIAEKFIKKPKENKIFKCLKDNFNAIRSRKEQKNINGETIEQVLKFDDSVYYRRYRYQLLNFLMKYRRWAFWITIIALVILHLFIGYVILQLLYKDKLDATAVTVFITGSIVETIAIFKMMTEKVFSTELEETSNVFMKKEGE